MQNEGIPSKMGGLYQGQFSGCDTVGKMKGPWDLSVLFLILV
jgi:hypothetical protein